LQEFPFVLRPEVSVTVCDTSNNVSSTSTVRYWRSGSQPPQADGVPVGAVRVMFVKATDIQPIKLAAVRSHSLISSSLGQVGIKTTC